MVQLFDNIFSDSFVKITIRILIGLLILTFLMVGFLLIKGIHFINIFGILVYIVAPILIVILAFSKSKKRTLYLNRTRNKLNIQRRGLFFKNTEEINIDKKTKLVIINHFESAPNKYLLVLETEKDLNFLVPKRKMNNSLDILLHSGILRSFHFTKEDAQKVSDYLDLPLVDSSNTYLLKYVREFNKKT